MLENVVEKKSVCLGLVEEDMPQKDIEYIVHELGEEVRMESKDLIFIQKSVGGRLFVNVKGT